VPTGVYLDWARDLTPTEAEFRSECLRCLPPVIFDAHSHANGNDAYIGLSKYGRDQIRSSFPAWSLDDSIGIRELTYADQRVRFLRFAQPYRGIDHVQANSYLIGNAPAGDLLGLYGLPDYPDYTTRQLRSGLWAALKMYPHYFEPAADQLTQFFPDEIVAVATELGIPLIVHLHAPITTCYREVLDLAGRHPEIRIVLAHLGREFVATEGLAAVWRQLSQIPGLVADTAMVCDAAVIASAIRHLGGHRVLYGSDEPCNLLRYVTYQHPDLGQRVSSDLPYHWLREDLRRDYGHIGKGAWLIHFQSLRAVLEAIDAVAGPAGRRLQQAIFHDNAVRYFSADADRVIR
jgi:hypothetical protein